MCLVVVCPLESSGGEEEEGEDEEGEEGGKDDKETEVKYLVMYGLEML